MMTLGKGHATSDASAGAFFERWTDHDTWPEWSPDTEWVRLDGPVRTGTRGIIKPRGGPRTKFVISACEPDHEYTDTTQMLGAELVFQHTATELSNGRTDLDVVVTIDGPLARLWTLIMGRGFRDSAQQDLDRLVRAVEATSSVAG